MKLQRPQKISQKKTVNQVRKVQIQVAGDTTNRGLFVVFVFSLAPIDGGGFFALRFTYRSCTECGYRFCFPIL